jgi:hypothetical protein
MAAIRIFNASTQKTYRCFSFWQCVNVKNVSLLIVFALRHRGEVAAKDYSTNMYTV